uniref:C2H2-type domain-containing protein n=1 Tax=Erpetoichthys calabaricus TaxID=27687 RepID=A0A8C4XD35_ERPCA
MSEGQDLNEVLTGMASQIQNLQIAHAATQQELEETKARLTAAESVRPEPTQPLPPPMVPLTDADNIEFYLGIFERTASQNQWPRGEWAYILAPYLKGAAQRAYYDLPEEEAANYDLLKPEILSRYSITTDQQASEWRTWQFDPEQPARAQAFDFWGKMGYLAQQVRRHPYKDMKGLLEVLEHQLTVHRTGGSEKPARGARQGRSSHPEPTRRAAEAPAKPRERPGPICSCLVPSDAHPLARHTNVTSPAHSPLPEKHLKTHSPEHTHSTHDFQCTFCSKSFRVQRYLNAHLKKHNTNRMMQCEHCQQCFKTNRALNKHLRTHSTLTFNCTFCNEDFTGEMDLHNHMQIHSTQTFVCKFCDKHFHARRYLTNHFKTHSLMNSFQCQHCSKTFTRQKSLKAHLNTHSTEQTHSKQIFQCTICSKTFRVQRYLNMHLKTHSTE